jgi:hypothetical protein
MSGGRDERGEGAPRRAGIIDQATSIDAILESFRYPRLLCRKGEPAFVYLPYRKDNREWLREDEDGETHGRRKPKWHSGEKCWEVPQNWRGEVTRKCVERFGGVVVISEGNSEVEKCAPACWNAVNDVTECVCSCGGWWHGKQNPGGFYVIGDSLAVRWKGADTQAIFITEKGSRLLASE